jgi:phosphatidylglycerol:prolipoprotein diacylglycerol transferase
VLTYPEIDPVALQLGPLAIRWYGLSYVAGILLAWWLLNRRAQRSEHWTPAEVGDLIFYGAVGVIIGGRLGSVLFYNLPYYLAHPLDIFRIWEGGMSFHGGLLGVLVAMLYAGWKFGKPFFVVSDFLVPVVPVGLFTGRLGNFANGELWGRPTDLPWGMVFRHVDAQPRHPSQLYEAALEGLLLFLLLWFYSKAERPVKAVSGLFLLGYGVLRFLVEFAREPDAATGYLGAEWMTRGQLLSLPMILFGLLFLILAYSRLGGSQVVRDSGAESKARNRT